MDSVGIVGSASFGFNRLWGRDFLLGGLAFRLSCLFRNPDASNLQEGFVIPARVYDSIIIFEGLKLAEIVAPDAPFVQSLYAMWIILDCFRLPAEILLLLHPVKNSVAVRLHQSLITLYSARLTS